MFQAQESSMAMAKAEALCEAKRSFWVGDLYNVRVEADGRPRDSREATAVITC